jgi:hypothetical protein
VLRPIGCTPHLCLQNHRDNPHVTECTNSVTCRNLTPHLGHWYQNVLPSGVPQGAFSYFVTEPCLSACGPQAPPLMVRTAGSAVIMPAGGQYEDHF